MGIKQMTLLVAILSLTLSATYAQSDSLVSATVYFYQAKGPGWLPIKYWVYSNDAPVCRLRNHSHCKVSIPAGKATFTTKLAFTAISKKKPSLTLNLEPGKTYYIQGDEKFNFFPPQGVRSFS